MPPSKLNRRAFQHSRIVDEFDDEFPIEDSPTIIAKNARKNPAKCKKNIPRKHVSDPILKLSQLEVLMGHAQLHMKPLLGSAPLPTPSEAVNLVFTQIIKHSPSGRLPKPTNGRYKYPALASLSLPSFAPAGNIRYLSPNPLLPASLSSYIMTQFDVYSPQKDYVLEQEGISKMSYVGNTHVSEHGLRVTAAPDWAAVQVVEVFTDNVTCPICLDTPTACTVNQCGHAFCLHCILQYFHSSDKNTCPCCQTPVYMDDFRPCVLHYMKKPQKGDEVTMHLLAKPRGGAFPVFVEGYNSIFEDVNPGNKGGKHGSHTSKQHPHNQHQHHQRTNGRARTPLLCSSSPSFTSTPNHIPISASAASSVSSPPTHTVSLSPSSSPSLHPNTNTHLTAHTTTTTSTTTADDNPAASAGLPLRPFVTPYHSHALPPHGDMAQFPRAVVCVDARPLFQRQLREIEIAVRDLLEERNADAKAVGKSSPVLSASVPISQSSTSTTTTTAAPAANSAATGAAGTGIGGGKCSYSAVAKGDIHGIFGGPTPPIRSSNSNNVNGVWGKTGSGSFPVLSSSSSTSSTSSSSSSSSSSSTPPPCDLLFLEMARARVCAWQDEWLKTPLGVWLSDYERLFAVREEQELDKTLKYDATERVKGENAEKTKSRDAGRAKCGVGEREKTTIAEKSSFPSCEEEKCVDKCADRVPANGAATEIATGEMASDMVMDTVTTMAPLCVGDKSRTEDVTATRGPRDAGLVASMKTLSLVSASAVPVSSSATSTSFASSSSSSPSSSSSGSVPMHAPSLSSTAAPFIPTLCTTSPTTANTTANATNAAKVHGSGHIHGHAETINHGMSEASHSKKGKHNNKAGVTNNNPQQASSSTASTSNASTTAASRASGSSTAAVSGETTDSLEPLLPNHILYYHGNTGAPVFLQPYLYRAIETVGRDAASGKFPMGKYSGGKGRDQVCNGNVSNSVSSSTMETSSTYCPSLPLLPLPTTLKLPIIDVERMIVTPDVKKRYPMCAHLPIGTETYLVTCDIMKIFPKSWHSHPCLQQARQRIQEKITSVKVEEKKHREWEKQRETELSQALLKELEREDLYGRSSYWTEERPGADDMDLFPSFGMLGEPALPTENVTQNKKKNKKTSRWSNIAAKDSERLQSEEWTPLGFF